MSRRAESGTRQSSSGGGSDAETQRLMGAENKESIEMTEMPAANATTTDASGYKSDNRLDGLIKS